MGRVCAIPAPTLTLAPITPLFPTQKNKSKIAFKAAAVVCTAVVWGAVMVARSAAAAAGRVYIAVVVVAALLSLLICREAFNGWFLASSTQSDVFRNFLHAQGALHSFRPRPAFLPVLFFVPEHLLSSRPGGHVLGKKNERIIK